MTRASRFLKNVTSNYVVTGVDILIFVLLTPFIVHRLGLEHYAVWVILQSIGFYLDFFDIGVPDAQVRQHSSLLKKKDPQAVSRLLGTVFVIYLAAAAAALLAAAGLAMLPTVDWLDIPESAADLYVPVLLLIGLTAAFSFVETGIDGIFEGYQRYDAANAIDLVFTVLSALAVVWALAAGFGLIALALIACVETLLSAATKYVAVRRMFPEEAHPRLGFDAATWRSIRSFSIWTSLDEFVTEGTAQFDRILIPILLASALVTPYSLVVALAAAIFALAQPITDTFLPIASARHQESDRHAMTAFLLRGTRLVTMATLPVTIVVVFFGQPILNLWVGEEYTTLHPTVLWFTAANFFFSTYLWTSLNVLTGAGAVKQIFRMSVFEVLLVLALILSLVPFFALPGLALAGLVANVLTGVFLFIPAACRLTTLRTRAFVGSSLVPHLLAATPAVIVAWLLSRWLDPTTWFETLAAAAVTALVALLSLLFFGTTPRDRARYYITVCRLAGLR